MEQKVKNSACQSHSHGDGRLCSGVSIQSIPGQILTRIRSGFLMISLLVFPPLVVTSSADGPVPTKAEPSYQVFVYQLPEGSPLRPSAQQLEHWQNSRTADKGKPPWFSYGIMKKPQLELIQKSMDSQQGATLVFKGSHSLNFDSKESILSDDKGHRISTMPRRTHSGYVIDARFHPGNSTETDSQPVPLIAPDSAVIGDEEFIVISLWRPSPGTDDGEYFLIALGGAKGDFQRPLPVP
jgi:hypothetical protein